MPYSPKENAVYVLLSRYMQKQGPHSEGIMRCQWQEETSFLVYKNKRDHYHIAHTISVDTKTRVAETWLLKNVPGKKALQTVIHRFKK